MHFLKLRSNGAIDHSEGNGRHLLENGLSSSTQRVKRFNVDVVMLFLALYRVFMSMQPLSFDSPMKKYKCMYVCIFMAV